MCGKLASWLLCTWFIRSLRLIKSCLAGSSGDDNRLVVTHLFWDSSGTVEK